MKRYEIMGDGLPFYHTSEDPKGEWVRFDDHAAEVARLTAALEAREATVVRRLSAIQPPAHAIGERCATCDQRLDAESDRDAYHEALLAQPTAAQHVRVTDTRMLPLSELREALAAQGLTVVTKAEADGARVLGGVGRWEVKRYIAQPGDWAMAESKDGAWMRFDDHAAEVARLTAALEAAERRVLLQADAPELVRSHEALQARVAELEAELRNLRARR